VPRTAEEVRRATDRLGVRPSRRMGQSFLVDAFVADAEAALLGAGPDEAVVEIGGGLGLLTEALLRRGVGSLTVVERDRRLATHLRRTFGGRIAVVEGDALEVDLPPGAPVVGNFPFSSGTAILQRLWRRGVPRVVGMLQREVVDRLTAAPHSRPYGRLTIQAALYGSVEPFQVVPSAAFAPSPDVEGRLFRFARREGPLPVPDVGQLEETVRLLFAGRRKQLGNLLPRVVRPPASPATAARTAGWPDGWARLRPEDLPPDAYFRLAGVLAGGRGAPAPAAR
jgi:16S rRNA (adenine1518-N6/adenine1519-N6)-dimethyltransferase